MKLYECPNNRKVRVLVEDKVPPGALQVGVHEVIDFKHIDGMYSYCINKDGQLVHLAAWTEVELVEE